MKCLFKRLRFIFSVNILLMISGHALREIRMILSKLLSKRNRHTKLFQNAVVSEVKERYTSI